MDKLKIEIGKKVIYKGIPALIIKIIDQKNVCINELEDHITHEAEISKLKPYYNFGECPKCNCIIMKSKNGARCSNKSCDVIITNEPNLEEKKLSDKQIISLITLISKATKIKKSMSL